MKTIVSKILLLIILGVLIFPLKTNKNVSSNQPIIIHAEKNKPDMIFVLAPNHFSEAEFQNNSFEYLANSQDVFSDIHGLRPFPWGGETFQGSPQFFCISDARTGNYAFEIQGTDIYDHGAIAVPDLEIKPLVEPNVYYYVSFWIKYDIKEGYGFRLTQQFFDQASLYPKYSCFGPWVNGSSNGQWVHLGLLVKSPPDAWRGDPVIELWGKGIIVVDDAYFGEVTMAPGGGK